MRRGTAVVITGVAGVLAGVLVFVGVVALTGSGKAKSRLGDDVFVVGRARTLAGTVDHAGPLLFQDLVGGAQDIYVQHIDGQWHAFAAHAPGAPRRCQLRWQRTTRNFVDRCSHAVYDAQGDGLTQYKIDVDRKGKLVVDLNSATAPIPPTSAPTTSP